MKTASQALAELFNHTVESIEDSEPIYFHQGEVMQAMIAFASQAIDEAANTESVVQYRKTTLRAPRQVVDRASILKVKELLK